MFQNAPVWLAELLWEPHCVLGGGPAPLFKAFLLCSFSSAHLQLRLSSLNCRIIVLQKYTVCFQDEARLVSALRSGSSLFLHLAVLPALLPASSCSQVMKAGDGWPFIFICSSCGVCGS